MAGVDRQTINLTRTQAFLCFRQVCWLSEMFRGCFGGGVLSQWCSFAAVVGGEGGRATEGQ
eukprot:758193-Hanusia_phi.AAC.1